MTALKHESKSTKKKLQKGQGFTQPAFPGYRSPRDRLSPSFSPVKLQALHNYVFSTPVALYQIMEQTGVTMKKLVSLTADAQVKSKISIHSSVPPFLQQSSNLKKKKITLIIHLERTVIFSQCLISEFSDFVQFKYNFNITAVCVSEGENVALKLQVRLAEEQCAIQIVALVSII